MVADWRELRLSSRCACDQERPRSRRLLSGVASILVWFGPSMGRAAGPAPLQPPPSDSGYVETVLLPGKIELWVMGTRVTGPTVLCESDGVKVRVGGIPLEREDAEPRPDSLIMARYGDVPRVAECLRQGMTVSQAYAVSESEVTALPADATAVY